MSAFAFAEVDSYDYARGDFRHCDWCSTSSCWDLCGSETRPFYETAWQGSAYTVCAACLDLWMTESEDQ